MAQQAQRHEAHLESRVAIAKDAIVDSVIARALRPGAAHAQRVDDSAAREAAGRVAMLAAEVESWGLTRRGAQSADAERRLEETAAALAAAVERIAALQLQLQLQSRDSDGDARAAIEGEPDVRLREALEDLEESHAARDELSVELQSIEDLVVAERAEAQMRER